MTKFKKSFYSLKNEMPLSKYFVESSVWEDEDTSCEIHFLPIIILLNINSNKKMDFVCKSYINYPNNAGCRSRRISVMYNNTYFTLMLYRKSYLDFNFYCDGGYCVDFGHNNNNRAILSNNFDAINIKI